MQCITLLYSQISYFTKLWAVQEALLRIQILHRAERKEQKLLPFYPMSLILCQNVLLRKLSKIFTDHMMISQVIFVCLSMKVLEKIKLGKLKRDVLIPQYTRNTVNIQKLHLTLYWWLPQTW